MEMRSPNEEPLEHPRYVAYTKLEENKFVSTRDELDFYRVSLCGSNLSWAKCLPRHGIKYFFKSKKDYELLRDFGVCDYE